MPTPTIVILAGPNGAGKTTAAPYLLRHTMGVGEFVNADFIAQGLSSFTPEVAAFAAGRAMLARMRELAGARQSFAFETKLSTLGLAPWLRSVRQSGIACSLVFLALPTPNHAVERVRLRVSQGGHDVPEPIVRRRYLRGLSNLVRLYQPIVDDWVVYDSSGAQPRLIAQSGPPEAIHDQSFYQQLLAQARSEPA